jgi:hypothetical protein
MLQSSDPVIRTSHRTTRTFDSPTATTMPLFKRKDKSVIPPVAPAPGYDPAPVSLSNTPAQPGAAARQQLFGTKAQTQKGPPAVVDPYANSRGGSSLSRGPPSYTSTPGDPYGDAKGSTERDQLFGDFTPKEPVQKVRKYGYEGRENEDDFDEDEEIEGIKQEMRDVKQESLAGTRNALRIAREAEDTARGTLSKLADQSGELLHDAICDACTDHGSLQNESPIPKDISMLPKLVIFVQRTKR